MKEYIFFFGEYLLSIDATIFMTKWMVEQKFNKYPPSNNARTGEKRTLENNNTVVCVEMIICKTKGP